MRRIEWYIICWFLWKKFMMMMNIWMRTWTLIFSFQMRVRSLSSRSAWFSLFVSHEPIISRHALKWNAAFHLSGAIFEFRRGSILAASIFTFGLSIFFISCYPYSHAIVHLFLFFHAIRKIISHSIFVQMIWDFFHDDPCLVYFFLMIFMKIVHVWIAVLARVCSYMSFFAPCLLFWSWNDDA